MGRRRGYDALDRFPASRPLQAEGGIRAQSARGAFVRNWWAKRWLAVLEGFGLGSRLARGRSYARQGQVLGVEVQAGEVRARVQGSRPTPYRVTIRLRPLEPGQWREVGAAIPARAAFAAKLLGGQLPEGLEEVFLAARAPLFPQRLSDLRTECSCPDASNPCKHIAAVYYLLAEEVDRDPFLLFRLRGMGQSELSALLLGPAAEGPPVSDPGQPVRREVGTAAKAEPAAVLPADPASFWGAGPPPTGTAATGPPGPAVGLALIRRMGNLPFWRGGRPMADALEPAYAQAARRAEAWLQGEAPAPGAGGPAAPPGKSRDRAALEADLRAGLPEADLRARYDGRLLRPYLGPAGGVGVRAR